LDSAIPDDAGGSSSVGAIERKRIEESSSSSTNTRAPPDYLLCQAFLEDVFAFVPKSKVVPFLEKLRDSNSMTKVRLLQTMHMFCIWCSFLLRRDWVWPMRWHGLKSRRKKQLAGHISVSRRNKKTCLAVDYVSLLLVYQSSLLKLYFPIFFPI
jgi:hypothetical protein